MSTVIEELSTGQNGAVARLPIFSACPDFREKTQVKGKRHYGHETAGDIRNRHRKPDRERLVLHEVREKQNHREDHKTLAHRGKDYGGDRMAYRLEVGGHHDVQPDAPEHAVGKHEIVLCDG